MFVGQLAVPATLQDLSSCTEQMFHCCRTFQHWISFDEGIVTCGYDARHNRHSTEVDTLLR